MLEPNNLIGLFIEDFDIKDFLSTSGELVQMTRDAESSGLKSGNILENLRVPLTVLLLGLMIIPLLVLGKFLVPRIKGILEK